ncbi:MAG: hypothetical protein IJ483_01335, partial [Flavobacteriales bacterium]|nr:hypothetical protein [Flavobacteriales bacterium]
MKALKLFFLLAIGSLSLGAAAQNYEVKGVVIDAKGNPVVGATVRTNKSKASAITRDGGVYTLTATPKDTELRLIMNKYTVMEKELSAAIASHPIAFELDETNDPTVTGYTVGDTYYPGEADASISDIFKNRFPELKHEGEYIRLKNSDYAAMIAGGKLCVDIDGSVGDRLTGIEPSQIYSIKVLKDGSSYGTQGLGGAVVIVTKAHHEENKSVGKADISVGKDTIRGVVKDGWGRVVPGMRIRTSSGEETVSDENGNYAIHITKKDNVLRCVMDYTEGTTVRITKANTAKPVNLIVMLRKNDLRGYFSDDMSVYFLGEADEDWTTIVALYPGTRYEDGDVYFDRWKMISLNSLRDEEPSQDGKEKTTLEKGCALLVVDGVAME